MKSILNPRKIVKSSKSLQDHLQEFTCLTHRLFTQAARRPISILPGIIQPLLWLTLFGSLFRNIPLSLFNNEHNYATFLSCGIIVFTSFTGSLNAGLPLVFDREFGFLNRILASPIISKYTIISGATVFIICLTMIQNAAIGLYSLRLLSFHFSYLKAIIVFSILLLITCSVSSISLGLAFILPGHIEFLAFVFIINLPTLFASTALAPIYFMPYWLQIISKINLLTYAIEGIRFTILNKHSCSEQLYAIEIFNAQLEAQSIIMILALAAILSFLGVKHIIRQKIE